MTFHELIVFSKILQKHSNQYVVLAGPKMHSSMRAKVGVPTLLAELRVG